MRIYLTSVAGVKCLIERSEADSNCRQSSNHATRAINATKAGDSWLRCGGDGGDSGGCCVAWRDAA